MAYDTLPSQETIKKTLDALTRNGFAAGYAAHSEEAKEKIFALLPKGAEVMNMTSVTLDALGITKEILESGKFDPVRKKLETLDSKTHAKEKRQLGSAPDWAVGSVHAATEDGHLLIASNTGSQLPAYAYGAAHIIWVVGAQKIVKDIQEGTKRIYAHSLPLESERAKTAYGVEGSFVSKLLIINRETQQGRAHVILVNEALGF